MKRLPSHRGGRRGREASRLERKREAQELGTPLPTPKTIESKRRRTEDEPEEGDEELAGEEAEDEFAPFWRCEREPKVFLTTRPRPSKHLFQFVGDLMGMEGFHGASYTA